MRYNAFGDTGLFVSELCLGAMTFGGGGVWQNARDPRGLARTPTEAEIRAVAAKLDA